MITKNIKKELLKVCLENIEGQCSALRINLASVEESRNNETKSSVGDKYETGRAMMQLEYQKLSEQLQRINSQIGELKVISVDIDTKRIGQGSLVETGQGIYFISTALGKVMLKKQLFFCISLQSPIGKLLNNKLVGDSFVFRGVKSSIQSIV